jgi:hypothetical protein
LKICFKCKREKDLSEFYRHPQMADGHLGKCKACARGDNRAWYRGTWKDRRAYELKRGKSKKVRERWRLAVRIRRLRHPGRYRCYSRVWAALASGKLKRQPCKKCGTRRKVQAHHKDYRKPFDIDWLCRRCHNEKHGRRTY